MPVALRVQTEVLKRWEDATLNGSFNGGHFCNILAYRSLRAAGVTVPKIGHGWHPYTDDSDAPLAREWSNPGNTALQDFPVSCYRTMTNSKDANGTTIMKDEDVTKIGAIKTATGGRQPGDIIVINGSHVGIYLGWNLYISASSDLNLPSGLPSGAPSQGYVYIKVISSDKGNQLYRRPGP